MFDDSIPKLGHRRQARPDAALIDRLSASSEWQGECRVWLRAKNSDGYGRLVIGRKATSAHRTAYQLAKGEIPHGLHLDHLCRNRACINPMHLEPVTNAENQARGLRASLTHCPKGHPYSGENLSVRPCGRGRMCLACNRERARATYARKRSEMVMER